MAAVSHEQVVAPSGLITDHSSASATAAASVPVPSESDSSLARQRDEAYERMLEALDALRGAQAEQAAARARVVELEHQVHVYLAENEHLRTTLAQRGRDQFGRRLAAAVRSRRPS